MKNRKYIYIAVSVITLSSAIILFSFYSTQSLGTPKFYFHRNYDSTSFSLLKRIKFQSEGVSKILVKNNYLYIYDLKGKEIKIFSANGDYIKSIGSNNTEKKSISLLMDFEVDSNTLSFLDVKNRGILDYDYNNKMLRYDTIGIFDRGVLINTGALVLIPNKTTDFDFGYFDRKTKKTTLTKISLPNYNDNGFTNDGFFKTNGQYILYVFYHIGKFMILDSSLNKSSLYSTIDGYDKPAQTSRFGNRTFLSHKTANINFDAVIDSNFIYIVSYVRSEEDKRGKVKGLIIDQYNLQGEYIKSLLLKNLPKSFNSFDVKEKELYILCSNEILIYQIN